MTVSTCPRRRVSSLNCFCRRYPLRDWLLGVWYGIPWAFLSHTFGRRSCGQTFVLLVSQQASFAHHLWRTDVLGTHPICRVFALRNFQYRISEHVTSFGTVNFIPTIPPSHEKRKRRARPLPMGMRRNQNPTPITPFPQKQDKKPIPTHLPHHHP